MDIERNVLQLIGDQSGFEMGKLKGDDNRHDLGFDSLDDVELIMSLEEKFDIVIPDTHAEELKTVRGIIDYITTAV